MNIVCTVSVQPAVNAVWSDFALTSTAMLTTPGPSVVATSFVFTAWPGDIANYGVAVNLTSSGAALVGSGLLYTIVGLPTATSTLVCTAPVIHLGTAIVCTVTVQPIGNALWSDFTLSSNAVVATPASTMLATSFVFTAIPNNTTSYIISVNLTLGGAPLNGSALVYSIVPVPTSTSMLSCTTPVIHTISSIVCVLVVQRRPMRCGLTFRSARQPI